VRDVIAGDHEKGTSTSKSEIRGFFAALRMTDIISATTVAVRML
jgi:hypothetical protein